MMQRMATRTILVEGGVDFDDDDAPADDEPNFNRADGAPVPVVAAGGRGPGGSAAADSAGPAAVAIGVLADGVVAAAVDGGLVVLVDLRAAAAETGSFNPCFPRLLLTRLVK